MRFHILVSSLLLLSGLSIAAPGRSPAVEDFVGIEVEHVEATPGNESLYNLERDVNHIETVRKDGPVDVAAPQMGAPNASTWSLGTILAVLFILTLPVVSWVLVMNHMKKRASQESMSNIEVLEKYRQERELARNKARDVKKAS